MKTKLLLLFLLPFSLKAQIGLFPNMLLDETLILDFICEPKYDKQNRVYQYSIGDLLTMNIQYNADGNIVKRTLHFQKDEDRTQIWEEILAYSGKELKTRDSKFHLLNEMEATHSEYTYTGNTITEIAITSGNDTVETQTTVTYLNKLSQPDSIVTYKIINNEKIRVNTCAFTYNEKGESILETFSHPLLTVAYYNEEHDKYLNDDKINYLQSFFNTSNMLDKYMYGEFYSQDGLTYTPVLQEVWYTVTVKITRENNKTSYSFIDENNQEILLASITKDSKGKIMEQNLSLNSIPLLQGEIVYTKNGANITKEILVSDYFKSLLPIPFHDISEAKAIKYTTDYTDKGESTSKYYLKKEIFALYEIQRERISVTDMQGNVSLYEMIDYYKGKVDDKEKFENKYNDRGLLTERQEYYWNDELDVYEINRKWVYDYDEKGNTILKQKYYYDKETAAWDSSEMNVSKYDAENNMILDERYSWNDNKKWEIRSRDVWQYTANSKTEENYSFGYGEAKDSVIYNEKGDKIESYTFTWENNKWENYKKKKIEDKDSIHIEETYVWKNNNWQPSYSLKRIEEENYYSQSEYKGDGANGWEETHRYMRQIVDTVVITERMSYSYEYKRLTGEQKSITYGNTNDLFKPYIHIEYKWNNSKMGWEAELKTSHSAEGQLTTDILESYNTVTGKWEKAKKLTIDYGKEYGYEVSTMYVWENSDWKPAKRKFKEGKADIVQLPGSKTTAWENFIKLEISDDYIYYKWSKDKQQWVKDRKIAGGYYSSTIYRYKNNEWIEIEDKLDRDKNYDLIDTYDELFYFELN